ncbi:MAG TPA: hypothetical protein PLB01_13065, partial [Thermoanaerobaculia bacterium]|nr:hypothetical protein [Thermoanaerobaculia bacterium]
MTRRTFLATLLAFAVTARADAPRRLRRILRLRSGMVEEVPLEDYVEQCYRQTVTGLNCYP